jgi:predicted GIY-YIG superfamily endonuclease
MLQSERLSTAHYVGWTEDLEARFKWHNHGSVPATRHLRPWQIKTAVMFSDEFRARAFDRYLKSGSGRSFAQKHF